MVPAYFITFAREHAPDRMNDICKAGIDFMINKGDRSSLQAAYRLTQQCPELEAYMKENTDYWPKRQ